MRNKLLKSIGVLTMAALLVVSNVNIVTVRAEEEAEVSEISVRSASDNDPASEITMPAPTNLSWENWSPSWDAVEGEDVAYRLLIYKDGEVFHSSNGYRTTASRPSYFQFGDNLLSESGTYKFTVCVIDSKYNVLSELTESPELVYARPEQQLGTTVGWWDSDTPTVFRWNPIENAGRYQLHIYKDGENTRSYITTSVNWCNISSSISSRGAGQYSITIRALSGDLDTIFHGDEGPQSGIYDTEVTASEVSEMLAGLLESNAEDILDGLQSLDQNKLKLAMQTNDDVLDQIKQLEEKYAQEQGITKSAPQVSDDAAKLVDSSKIDIVGGALSAADNSSFALKVDVSTVTNPVYKNCVQLDISLINSNDGNNITLKTPVTVTMPIPAGINANKLVIHHYSGTNYETVPFKNNGDGTITFSVTHFSRFEFVNEEEPEDEDAPEDEGTPEEPAETPAGTAMTSPKTGETAAIPMALCAGMLACVGATVVIYCRKLR